MPDPNPAGRPRRWPDHAALWRWHFYAGLLCLPFFCWLALTGMAYLFRPDIEAWLDKPYESLVLDGPSAAPSALAGAALAAVPGATFGHYELPATPTGAAQVVVTRDGLPYRVYVHPRTLQPMRVMRDDHRPMDVVSRLHGELLMGTPGSMLMETAGCWGVVMILTGLCLWFPRGSRRLAGVVYPRLQWQGRVFWRDLHAVTGLWICTVTLFLLLSGLPWAANWGNYFTWLRNHWPVAAGTPDWSLGGGAEPLPTFASPAQPAHARHALAAIDAAEAGAMPDMGGMDGQRHPPDLRALDRVVPVAARLHVPRPFWILPPPDASGDWIIASRAQDRPQRVDYAIDPASAAIVGRKDFDSDGPVNQAINVAIAAHEGQLFGRPNQALLLLNALGVLLVSVSAVVMWWRRRPGDALGAPRPVARPRTAGLVALVLALLVLTVAMPLFGASLLLVLLIERLLLRRKTRLSRWLGLVPTPPSTHEV